MRPDFRCEISVHIVFLSFAQKTRKVQNRAFFEHRSKNVKIYQILKL